MDYKTAIKFISEIPWTKRAKGLGRMERLLDLLGNPQDMLRFVHIAGTNGKGSTAAMLASIFKAAGMKTGLFTSPHLIKYNERIKIDGEDISNDNLAEIITIIETKTAQMEETPTEFEILTAAGFIWFAKNNCDIVVLEVGLGGEFDSTNVIGSKELAIITAIGFDHTAILGDSIEEIAEAKAGIISDFSDVILYRQGEKVTSVIRERCEEKHARLHIPDTDSLELLESNTAYQCFKTNYLEYPTVLTLTGRYQLQNALVVLEACRVLRERGINISDKAILQGLKTVKWASRFELLSDNPKFILDGAHNDHGISAVVDSLTDLFPDKKIIYILGVLSDKNVDKMLDKLYTNAECFITLTPESERALTADLLAEKIKAAGFDAWNYINIEEAVKAAFKMAGEDKIICSLGSLYLAGPVKAAVQAVHGSPEQQPEEQQTEEQQPEE
ncbi:MAG: bifunctional folylpolyglutamate synthase/dihydrofolate synthase [Lachnospiraceae bacterium]|nr:bifunctional folylpolyglutamate synthase/dihydrofolate synthase [Lachnospiraceae bacterium]